MLTISEIDKRVAELIQSGIQLGQSMKNLCLGWQLSDSKRKKLLQSGMSGIIMMM